MITRFWTWLTRPSPTHALGVIGLVGVLLAGVTLAGFDATMHATSTDAFCLSCHELQLNIGYEYEEMSHAKNARGVRATCSDCHLPKPFVPKMLRKMRAINEVYHHVVGTLGTPEKFESHRMTMATRVWADMRDNDSRECRNCHDSGAWNLADQSEETRDFHQSGLSNGKTCIACHKGVAHSLPAGIEPDTEVAGIGTGPGAGR